MTNSIVFSDTLKDGFRNKKEKEKGSLPNLDKFVVIWDGASDKGHRLQDSQACSIALEREHSPLDR